YGPKSDDANSATHILAARQQVYDTKNDDSNGTKSETTTPMISKSDDANSEV
ncbi:7129_t:CDS:1, partial [Racocetra persica]